MSLLAMYISDTDGNGHWDTAGNRHQCTDTGEDGHSVICLQWSQSKLGTLDISNIEDYGRSGPK